MKNLSVIVNDGNNNGTFIRKLYSEAAAEFDVGLSENKISFSNLTEENSVLLSDILARNIISEFQKKMLISIINKNCTFLDKGEKLEVWKLSMKQLLNDEYFNNNDYLYRFEIVRQKVYECLESSNTLSVDGFVNFRLGEYMRDLEGVVEDALHEYVLEIEYKEFISMLRYFVSVQTPKYFSVDVIYGKDIKLLSEGIDITEECKSSFGIGVERYPLQNDDFLLDSLVILAPKSVVVHIGETDMTRELKETLSGVFGNKIEYRYDGKGVH